ncbi:MAG TPA: hypothetical protein VEC19_11275 [Usitatibacter sp.]|nr:hypothetical protein [Usitatibacter sp.]
MNRNRQNDSYATFSGGRYGMVIGAVAGALVFAIGSLAMDLLDVGAGGPGLAVMSGAAFGGLMGMILGALRARPGGHGNYEGSERRMNRGPYLGEERRAPGWMAHG